MSQFDSHILHFDLIQQEDFHYKTIDIRLLDLDIEKSWSIKHYRLDKLRHYHLQLQNLMFHI